MPFSLNMDFKIIEDGSIYREDNVVNSKDYFELFDYSKYGSKVKFVGFIIKKDEMIVSFPKNYGLDGLTDNDIRMLSKLLLKTNSIKVLDNGRGDISENFPLEAYLNVCNYYAKHGLYKKNTNYFSEGYNGKINWNLTLRKSNKILIDNKLLLFPFIVEKKISMDVFVTECMIEVLSKGFERFGSLFDIGVPFHGSCKYDVLNNSDIIIKTLQQILPQYNNDEVKKLVLSIIEFIKWQSSNQNITIFTTKSFDYIWQSMVDFYLNNYLKVGDNNFQFDFFIQNNNNFYREFSHKIYDESTDDKRNFSVRYDHFLIKENQVFLFDSKYYTDEIFEINYKQLSYHFILKDWLHRTKGLDNIVIHNGLVLPTAKHNFERVHIETSNKSHHPMFRDLLIKEYYVNMKELINKYVSLK